MFEHIEILHTFVGMASHLCTHYKSHALAAIPMFEHIEILHTFVGMASAALVAAVPYLVSISHKEQ